MMRLRGRSSRRVAIVAFATLALPLAACSPYQAPAFLQNTPGAAVTVYDQTYAGEAFSVVYPNDWRVITPPAEAPEAAVFAGENCQIVFISTIAIEPSSPAECTSEQMRFETLEREGLFLYGGAPSEQWPSFEPVFAQIADLLIANHE
ncbi:MAG: hypothetical protein IAE89_05900 [Anaerolineae bacterium]|nr:hypothetical protein [Anaerolineae bacterium]